MLLGVPTTAAPIVMPELDSIERADVGFGIPVVIKLSLELFCPKLKAWQQRFVRVAIKTPKPTDVVPLTHCKHVALGVTPNRTPTKPKHGVGADVLACVVERVLRPERTPSEAHKEYR